MNVERTYHWIRMLQSHVQFSLTAALPPTLFLADCIINIVESEFSIGTGAPARQLRHRCQAKNVTVAAMDEKRPLALVRSLPFVMAVGLGSGSGGASRS
jgi:hypothetical protein